ncbi:MAG TPA: DEAD/DEAH box helicase [Bacteroidales bacterium]|nr:DEAD/DEAH box helicase [Bacteroidales bacterium]
MNNKYRKNRFEKSNTTQKTNRTQKSRYKKQPDVTSFIKNVPPGEESLPYQSQRIIKDLPVNASIINNLLKKGYISPTEIQDRSIEPILNGQDLMGLAQTGTGKTGAFLIPLAHNLLNQKPSFQILIITPTRELAVQIETEFRSITAGLRLFSECLIGGTSVSRDIYKLKRPCHVIIGTPGRICDMVRQKALNLNDFSTLVLDEFDRLLDMGFSTDILQIVDQMSNRNQTILFSATEDKTQRSMLQKILNSPVEIRLKTGNTSAGTVDQEILEISKGENRMDVLIRLVDDPSFEKVLVFSDTKRSVSKICSNLKKAGIRADEIHGDKSQNYRLKALESFRNRKIRVLVATDVAARGLDIVNVSHVINFQPPQNMENYIHRIGRTGRAGKSGKALTFVG